MKIGVLSFQGSVAEHLKMLKKINGVEALPVKSAQGLNDVSALILPGGESTVLSRLLRLDGLLEPLKERIKNGMPVWGTCAGMILLAREIAGEPPHLGVMDISVRRNAYGSQLFSFSKKVFIDAVKKEFNTVFIRAPLIEKTGKGVDILLELDGKIVAARQGNMLVTSFHPELGADPAFHRYFTGTASTYAQS